MIKHKPNEGRDAPAFQEYAATMMGRLDYRMLSLAHRGLLYTLRLEWWVNQKLPNQANKLATVLGLNGEEVARLLPGLEPFFEIIGDYMYSPDLECYRAKVQDRRNRQSLGGKEGRRRQKEKLHSSNLQAPSNQDSSNSEVLREDKYSSGKSKPVYKRNVSNPLNNSDLDPDIDVPF